MLRNKIISRDYNIEYDSINFENVSITRYSRQGDQRLSIIIDGNSKNYEVSLYLSPYGEVDIPKSDLVEVLQALSETNESELVDIIDEIIDVRVI